MLDPRIKPILDLLAQQLADEWLEESRGNESSNHIPDHHNEDEEQHDERR